MNKIILSFFILFASCTALYAQCTTGNDEIIVQIQSDNYPAETTWNLKNSSGTILASGGSVGDTLCVPSGTCLQFNIFDTFGDGICCNYGNGFFKLYVNTTVVSTGGNFGNSDTRMVNCPPGSSCFDPLMVTTGTHSAPNANTWYSFTPTVNGMYSFSTCNLSNTCDTKLWIYDHCAGLVFDNTNIGTILYDDNAGGCGQLAVITAAMTAGETVFIRVGDSGGSCAANPISWSVTYQGPIVGCMDVSACNYNPQASVAGTCYYWPDANCPPGPDLLIVQSAIENTLYMDKITASNCHVQENCLRGYGMRDILRFDTHIKNIGATDYYIGNPTSNPGQFTTGNCHGHTHYEGYAEYVLYKSNGTAIPIGFKNGFCVLDLECSGGGNAQYGCGNMGISHGCGDIYAAGLDCQWIDITDIEPGQYTLAVKVNWDQSPDALGRPESDYTNNWAQVCLTIAINGTTGDPVFTVNSTCPPYVDCAGTPYGNALIDCNGVCGGNVKRGDLDVDAVQEITDAQQYVSKIIDASISPTSCNDLNADAEITVWDAALLTQCVRHSNPFNSVCDFPRGAINTNQTVELKIDSVNIAQQYIDIAIKNPQNYVLAYEFNVSGIKIANVYSLVDPNRYPIWPSYKTNGNKVIGISYQDSTVNKNTSFSPLCRIYFSSIESTSICISDIVHIVNNNYEATNTQISGTCYTINTTALEELQQGKFLAVYPNPTNGNFTIELQSSATNNGTIEITNTLGAVVFTSQLNENNSGKLVIDMSNEPKGIYFVNYTSKTQNTTKKIVVK